MKLKTFHRDSVFRLFGIAALYAVPMLAQDVISTSLTKFGASVNVWVITLTLLGVAWLGGKYMFKEHHEAGDLFKTLFGGVLMLGAGAAANYYFT